MLGSKQYTEWPTHSFYVVDTRVFPSREEAAHAAGRSGQNLEPIIISPGSVKSEIDSAIEKLRHRTPEQVGTVARNRGILRGAPTIAGTRIPTATIAWFHDNGYALDWILTEFPRLTAEDVRVAVDFERGREARMPDPVLAHA